MSRRNPNAAEESWFDDAAPGGAGPRRQMIGLGLGIAVVAIAGIALGAFDGGPANDGEEQRAALAIADGATVDGVLGVPLIEALDRLHGRLAETADAREAAPDNPDDLEQVVLDNLRFHIEVMRVSRIPQIPEMARMVLPNALHRRIAWSQRAEDAEQSCRMHQKIANAIAERSSAMARLLMREDIYSSREAVQGAVQALAAIDAPETATIKRFGPTFELDGRIYGQGTRESGADGRLVPFGVPAAKLR